MSIDRQLAEDAPPAVRELEIQASPEEVWEALATEEGRERWLEESDRAREIHIETAEHPHRLSWWWGGADEPFTHVDFEILPVAGGSRVRVVETPPAPAAFPLARLASSLSLVVA